MRGTKYEVSYLPLAHISYTTYTSYRRKRSLKIDDNMSSPLSSDPQFNCNRSREALKVKTMSELSYPQFQFEYPSSWTMIITKENQYTFQKSNLHSLLEANLKHLNSKSPAAR